MHNKDPRVGFDGWQHAGHKEAGRPKLNTWGPTVGTGPELAWQVESYQIHKGCTPKYPQAAIPGRCPPHSGPHRARGRKRVETGPKRPDDAQGPSGAMRLPLQMTCDWNAEDQVQGLGHHPSPRNSRFGGRGHMRMLSITRVRIPSSLAGGAWQEAEIHPIHKFQTRKRF